MAERFCTSTNGGCRKAVAEEFLPANFFIHYGFYIETGGCYLPCSQVMQAGRRAESDLYSTSRLPEPQSISEPAVEY